MERKILLSILILFGIFVQGFESQSQEHTDESSDHHIRKKRIIDTSHDRNEAFLHQEIPYVVRILNVNKYIICTGIILKPRIILTAAHCVYNRTILIASGSRVNGNTQIHKVVSKFVHEHYDPAYKANDMAMVLINNPIDLIHSFHRPIELYEGRILPNTHGLITGWGCTVRDSQQLPSQPLSILVPILSLEQCQQAYGNLVRFSDREICTYSANRSRCCWSGDSGAPLAVNGYLVGVFFCFHQSDQSQFPDVFVNLLHPENKNWIVEKINYIHRHY